jgi:hypothetical protein
MCVTQLSIFILQPAYYNYTFVDAGATVDDDESQCSTKLVLRFDPPEDEGDANYVTFNFAEVSRLALSSLVPWSMSRLE